MRPSSSSHGDLNYFWTKVKIGQSKKFKSYMIVTTFAVILLTSVKFDVCLYLLLPDVTTWRSKGQIQQKVNCTGQER